jgi:hypothetical protein
MQLNILWFLDIQFNLLKQKQKGIFVHSRSQLIFLLADDCCILQLIKNFTLFVLEHIKLVDKWRQLLGYNIIRLSNLLVHFKLIISGI